MKKDEAIQDLQAICFKLSLLQEIKEVQKYVEIEEKHLKTLQTVIKYLETN